jgi:subtilase family serine protease
VLFKYTINIILSISFKSTRFNFSGELFLHTREVGRSIFILTRDALFSGSSLTFCFVSTSCPMKGVILLRKYIITTCLPILLVLLPLGFLSSPTFAASRNAGPALTFKRACSQAAPGFAGCFAIVSTTGVAAPKAPLPASLSPFASAPGSSAPYSPTALHNAYNLPTTASTALTVAIVDAYNDPNAESDLATYRSSFGLSACTTANGCFRKVNQAGGTSYPANNTGWSEEISLDVDMVSAICQNCHILLVEATSSSLANLGIAVNEAAILGAAAISNSYGTAEFSGESSYCSSYYNHSGIAVTVSTGDGGPGVEFPSVCTNVTGVGGTTLSTTGAETAWNTSSTEGAGGGCSSQIAIPSWESSSVTGCSRRATGDVSADADPATGVYVYDTYGESGGLEFGGTSVSSPIIASVFALAGGTSGYASSASLPWSDRANGCLNTVGSVTYAYQTGLGSPQGISCF